MGEGTREEYRGKEGGVEVGKKSGAGRRGGEGIERKLVLTRNIAILSQPYSIDQALQVGVVFTYNLKLSISSLYLFTIKEIASIILIAISACLNLSLIVASGFVLEMPC